MGARPGGYPARGAWIAALASMAALQLVWLFETLLLPVHGHTPNAVVWAVQALPLAAFVPGMIRGRARVFIWLCFILLLYFAVAVLAVFAHPRGFYGWSSLVLVCSLYIASMLFARWRQRQLAAPA